MGRKGTSKRKPKKNKQNVIANVSSNSPVQALVQEKGAPIQNDTNKTPGGWNKNKKRH